MTWRRRNGRIARRHPGLSTALAIVCLLTLWPPATVQAADPVLTLEPIRGTCAARAIVRGQYFPPSRTVALSIGQAGANGDLRALSSSTVVAPDGSFTIVLEMRQYLSGCTTGPVSPPGTQYLINAAIVKAGTANEIESSPASATFTVAPATAPTPLPGLPNTGGGGMRQRCLARWGCIHVDYDLRHRLGRRTSGSGWRGNASAPWK